MHCSIWNENDQMKAVVEGLIKKWLALLVCVCQVIDVRGFHPRRPRGSQSGRRKRLMGNFLSGSGRAPGYRLSLDHFQTIKRMLAPDWTQKCFVLLGPIDEQYLLSSSFGELVHDGYCLVIVARFVHKGRACKENFHFLLS